MREKQRLNKFGSFEDPIYEWAERKIENVYRYVMQHVSSHSFLYPLETSKNL